MCTRVRVFPSPSLVSSSSTIEQGVSVVEVLKEHPFAFEQDRGRAEASKESFLSFPFCLCVCMSLFQWVNYSFLLLDPCSTRKLRVRRKARRGTVTSIVWPFFADTAGFPGRLSRSSDWSDAASETHANIHTHTHTHKRNLREGGEGER